MGNNSSKSKSQTLGDVRTPSTTKIAANKSVGSTAATVAAKKAIVAKSEPLQSQISYPQTATKRATQVEPVAYASPKPIAGALPIVPARPENLGDALKVVDDVKEATELEQKIDAEALVAAKQAGLPLQEGRYSVYNSAVAHSRLPSVACGTDCVREAQMRFRDAQYVLRCQRDRALPCHSCADGGRGFAFENNVRSARTNDALLRREQRTMQANLQARSRRANSSARPSTLVHLEPTTRTSDAALPLATLADKASEGERKTLPMIAKAQAANEGDETATASTSGVSGANRERPSRLMAIKTMHMNAQSPSDCNCALAPVVRFNKY